MNAYVIFLIVLATAVALLVGLRSWRQRRTLADKLAARPSMEFETFYKNFYDGKINRAAVGTHITQMARFS